MDCIRGMFPFINVPLISNTSLSDIFSSCLTCQPFGNVKKRAVEAETKPSREVKTISSLVDKFASAYDPKSGGQDTLQNHGFRTVSNSFYKPCSRKTSFSLDMNHEKFTPCEKNRFNENDFSTSSINSDKSGDYGKIDYNHSNLIYEKNFHEVAIVAPPRRKKRPAPKALFVNCKDISIKSNLEHELKKNYQNLKLNNLNKPNTNYEKNNNNNNGNRNNNGYHSVSCLTNNKINNKSGCSNLEVVSDSLVSNAMHFSNFDSVSDTANIITDNFETGYCENKIYYKNSSFDKFGNYRHGNDSDEVIVCESITEFDPTTASRNRSPEQNIIPENSVKKTVTKFHTDTIYQDRLKFTTSRSDEEWIEQIVQLQPNINPLLISEISVQKTGRNLSEKEQTEERKESKNDNSTDRNEIRDQDHSIPVVFCAILPTHDLNTFKCMQAVQALPDATENWPANSDTFDQFEKDIQTIKNFKTTDSVGRGCSGFEVVTGERRRGIDCKYSETDRCEL